MDHTQHSSIVFTSLLQISEEFEQLHWSEIEPWYRELTAVTLTPEILPPWMLQWSRLSELVEETLMRMEKAITQNTADLQWPMRRQRFLSEKFTHIQTFEQQIKQKLLASNLEPDNFSIPLRNLRADATLFHEENVALLNEEKRLNEKYMEINGTQTVLWDGKERPITFLTPIFHDPDRSHREHAWRTFHKRKLEDSSTLNELWIKTFQLHQRFAHNAGFDNFRDYRWQQLHRFDYTPADCKQFHEAVAQVIVPIANQIAEKRRKLLGVEALRPWDILVDPRATRTPRAINDVNALLRQCTSVFHQIDPALGGYFDTMIEQQCFDLEVRPNKAPGGYNMHLDAKGLPFIFGQVQTIEDDTEIIFHEAGHAFHLFESRSLPYFHQRREEAVPIEFGEVASISLEYIGGMHLCSSGLCTADEAQRMRIQSIERTILELPRLIMGDAFQHWAYEHPDQATDPTAIGQQWLELHRRFQPWVDWSGLETVLRNTWQHTLHFYVAPLYYIEYAFATLGALQIWRNYQHDPRTAIQRYRQALSLGGTRPLPELYATAGAIFAFDITILQDMAQLLLSALKDLESGTKEDIIR